MCSQSRHPLLILTSLNVPHTRVFSSAAKTLSGGRVRSPRCFLLRRPRAKLNVSQFSRMGILVSSFPIRARLDFPHTRVFPHLGEIRATGVFAYGHSVSRFSTSRVPTTTRTRFRGDNELERDFPRPKGKNLYHTGSSTKRDSSVSRGTLGTRVP